MAEHNKQGETSTSDELQRVYGFCRRCGRTIKNPKSVVNGIGSTCIKKLGLAVGASEEEATAALARYEAEKTVVRGLSVKMPKQCERK